VLYTPARLLAIAKEAGKANSIFSLDDRIGLVSDAFALAKAGYLSLSATLNLVHELRADRECEYLVHVYMYNVKLTRKRKVLTWDSIDKNLTEIIHTWYEDDKVTQGLKAFRRVRSSLYPIFTIFVLDHLIF
jgi:aminopeptidase 2